MGLIGGFKAIKKAAEATLLCLHHPHLSELIQIVLYLALAVFAMELFAFGVIGKDGKLKVMEVPDVMVLASECNLCDPF